MSWCTTFFWNTVYVDITTVAPQCNVCMLFADRPWVNTVASVMSWHQMTSLSAWHGRSVAAAVM